MTRSSSRLTNRLAQVSLHSDTEFAIVFLSEQILNAPCLMSCQQVRPWLHQTSTLVLLPFVYLQLCYMYILKKTMSVRIDSLNFYVQMHKHSDLVEASSVDSEFILVNYSNFLIFQNLQAPFTVQMYSVSQHFEIGLHYCFYLASGLILSDFGEVGQMACYRCSNLVVVVYVEV